MPKLKLPTFLNRLNTKGNKRKLLGLAITLTIILISTVGWSTFNRVYYGKLYAQAAGHNIYEQEVRDLIGGNKDISNHDAAKVLADKYLTEALAKEQGISVSDQDIEAKYGKDVLAQKDKNKYAYQNQINQLYFEKLQIKNRGVYKGKLLVTNFSRHVAFESALLKEDKAANPKIGDPAAIAADKKYAEDLINRLYNDIKSGKITFDQAIQIERNDPAAGEKAYPTLLHSGSFDSTSDPNGLIAAESIRRQISGLKPGQLSQPKVIKVENSLDGKSLAESYFLVVQMDELSGNQNPDFKRYLEEAEKRLGYKIYV